LEREHQIRDHSFDHLVLVSYGAGILFKDQLNHIKIGGFKLGFWFAQQGAMYVFVILIFVYVNLMNKLDKKYGYDK